MRKESGARVIRIGKKFFKPHLCPDCGRLVVLVRHPKAVHCPKCRNKKHHKSAGHRKQQKKYNNSTYRRKRKTAMTDHPYCALCGRSDHLTCHHAVNVRTGEWAGKHVTVLCEKCHGLWETKVNKIRGLER